MESGASLIEDPAGDARGVKYAPILINALLRSPLRRKVDSKAFDSIVDS